MALRQAQVDRARHRGEGRYTDFLDGSMPGFGVRVYPSRRKVFFLYYSIPGRRSARLTLGTTAELTLDAARDRAREALVDVRKGKDPEAERRKPAAMTLAEFAPIYLERHSKPHKKTWREDERRLKKHVLPALGRRSLAKIDGADVARLHAKIGRRAPVEANRVLALLSVVFSYAGAWGHLPKGHENPTAGVFGNRAATRAVKPFREKSRERYVRPAELPRLEKAIEAEKNPYIKGVLRFMLLTGLRKSEALAAKWDDIDRDRQELHLADTKAGRRHVVPLSTAAQEVLNQVPRMVGNPFIFCGAKPRQPLKYIDRAWRRIRTRAELPDVHLHDLRRTVGSRMAADGVPLALIGKVLNHSNPSTTAIYARLGEDMARAALEDYGAKVYPIASGAEK